MAFHYELMTNKDDLHYRLFGLSTYSLTILPGMPIDPLSP